MVVPLSPQWIFSSVSIPFMVFLISDLNLSNCHCCNYILICYFSAITSCPIHHRHGNYFFFLFAAAWFHLKDGGVPSLRLSFTLCSPRLFSYHFWVPDLLLIPSAMSWAVPCLPRDVLEMWPHHCWASKHNYLMFLQLPAGRSLLFGCVGTYWGPGTGTDPWVKEGGSISQSAAGIQKIFQWCFYHPTLCSYLFHYINCSSKGDLPRLRNHFSLICLPSLVMLKCSSTRDDITAVSENSFQN